MLLINPVLVIPILTSMLIRKIKEQILFIDLDHRLSSAAINRISQEEKKYFTHFHDATNRYLISIFLV